MRREHDVIPSRELGRGVHLWRFGHYGAPLLVFPSASGMAHEWEANGMIALPTPRVSRAPSACRPKSDFRASQRPCEQDPNARRT
jgi:hypothetical protein